jgi:acyl-CoA synthetase (NDP forming)
MVGTSRQLGEIINARSLAIVGASSAPMKFGTLMTRAQMEIGFDGPVYLVNPREKEIMGHPVYPDLESLPRSPELLYLALPALRSMDVLEQAARTGVKGVVMLASGFREAGDKGLELERRAVEIARAGGFRIIGPNCFGIYNPRTGLTVLPGHDFSRDPGDIAFISQSGGFSVHVARQGISLGLSFSAVVSYGNACDVDAADLIEYFAVDGDTRIISGYLEGIQRGHEFRSALDAASRASKPVVIWKVGRKESSRQAVASHTGSMAGSSEVWDGLMKQYGVIQTSGVDETLDVLLALKKLGRKPGRRLMLAGGGGGLGTYAADVAGDLGLEVPPPDRAIAERLARALARPGASVGNPLDIGAPLIPLDEFRSAVSLACLDRATDVFVFDLALNFAYDVAGEPGLDLATDIIIESASESGKPTAVVLYSRSNDEGNLLFEDLVRRYSQKFQKKGIAVFPSAPRALAAISLIN